MLNVFANRGLNHAALGSLFPEEVCALWGGRGPWVRLRPPHTLSTRTRQSPQLLWLLHRPHSLLPRGLCAWHLLPPDALPPGQARRTQAESRHGAPRPLRLSPAPHAQAHQCLWSMCCRMRVCGATVPYLSTSGMFMSSMK